MNCPLGDPAGPGFPSRAGAARFRQRHPQHRSATRLDRSAASTNPCWKICGGRSPHEKCLECLGKCSPPERAPSTGNLERRRWQPQCRYHLAGPRRRLALVETTLRDRVTAMGLKEVEDVRGRQAGVDQRVPADCDRRMAVHQPNDKVIHLRDFATPARRSPGLTNRTFSCLQSFNSWTRAHAFSVGVRWFHFVGGVGAGRPGDPVRLGAQSVRAAASAGEDCHSPEPPAPEPVREGERIVAFVISDGDNVRWLLNGMATSRRILGESGTGPFRSDLKCAPPDEIAPGPRLLLQDRHSRDDFIAGPSGAGYYFPRRPGPSAVGSKWRHRTPRGWIASFGGDRQCPGHVRCGCPRVATRCGRGPVQKLFRLQWLWCRRPMDLRQTHRELPIPALGAARSRQGNEAGTNFRKASPHPLRPCRAGRQPEPMPSP